ncbi:hypothetical protein J6590_000293 [Homalodisca vitripennis]|nr:hypothetical protein J6590_000293 [Homalodisca vitripennis]
MKADKGVLQGVSQIQPPIPLPSTPVIQLGGAELRIGQAMGKYVTWRLFVRLQTIFIRFQRLIVCLSICLGRVLLDTMAAPNSDKPLFKHKQ